jgi:hypothetical protein
MTIFWYIWKARNDMRFQRKKWSVLQVHRAVEADINVATSGLQTSTSKFDAAGAPRNHSSHILYGGMPFAGFQANGHDQGMVPSTRRPSVGLSSNQRSCSLPSLLSGPRCYSDASTTPDNISSDARKAGLGIFFLDPSHQITFYIKAQINQVTSVIMAEAAAMALVAWITSLLHIRNTHFLTDNQLLPNFFNGSDLCSPPHWDIKPFTQRFLNAVANSNCRVHKIHRSFNTTAHLLATQSF